MTPSRSARTAPGVPAPSSPHASVPADSLDRPLRVLLVTEASSAGVGRHVIDLAEGLVARGHDVHLVYSARRIDRPFQEGLDRITGLARLEVPMRRGPHPSDARALAHLARYRREHGPFDIVHAHSTKAGILVRSLPRRAGTRVAYTPHCIYTMNPDLGRVSRTIARGVETSLIGRTDALVAVSPDEGDHVLQLGMAPGRVHVVPNGIEPIVGDRAAARAALGLPQDALVVGFVGRLCHQKDPALLVEAFARLAPGRPGLCLAMVGTGPLEEEVRARAAGLGTAVHWLGHRTPQQAMPAFDLLALPSRYEGLPYVLLEALAAGLPIVATEVGGVRLVVEDGVNGHVVPAGDPAALARALERFVDDPEHRVAAATSARERAPRFSVDEMVSRTETLYRTLLGR